MTFHKGHTHILSCFVFAMPWSQGAFECGKDSIAPYQGSGLVLNNLIEAFLKLVFFFLFRFLKDFTDFHKILDKNLDLKFFSIQQNKLCIEVVQLK